MCLNKCMCIYSKNYLEKICRSVSFSPKFTEETFFSFWYKCTYRSQESTETWFERYISKSDLSLSITSCTYNYTK